MSMKLNAAVGAALVAAAAMAAPASQSLAASKSFKATAEYMAQRTKKVGFIRVPEFKHGRWTAFGKSCAEASAKGRRSVSGSGWKIKWEKDQRCDRS